MQIPAGFGFLPGDHKFSVVGWTLKGFFGWCEICHAKVFNYTSKKRFIKYPRRLNKTA
jgi:5-methylcytosine-specific restriction endonuclease McrA